jgi:hypothetical protein
MMVPQSTKTCRVVIDIFTTILLYVTCARVCVIVHNFNNRKTGRFQKGFQYKTSILLTLNSRPSNEWTNTWVMISLWRHWRRKTWFAWSHVQLWCRKTLQQKNTLISYLQGTGQISRKVSMEDKRRIGLNETIILKWTLRKCVMMNSLNLHWTGFNGEML